jgi:hypothetical protein
MQDRLLATDDQCVAGIVTTLESHHRGGTVGEEVDNLTFTLVTPLGADDDNILTHA